MNDIYLMKALPERFAGFGTDPEELLDVFTEALLPSETITAWDPPALSLIESVPPLPVGDLATFQGLAFVFSTRAVDALHTAVEGAAQFLPAAFEDQTRWILNVTAVADILDADRSVVDLVYEGGGMIDIRELVLKKDAPQPPPIFKVPSWESCRPLVTDKFRRVVEDASLTGFDFRRLTNGNA